MAAIKRRGDYCPTLLTENTPSIIENDGLLFLVGVSRKINQTDK